MAKYANLIIDCTAESVDRVFTYRIPDSFSDEIVPGVCVDIPFGNAKKPRTGYVTEILETPPQDVPEEKLRDILSVSPAATRAEADLIRLARFLADEYGSTMSQALKTVLPVKKSVRHNRRRTDPTAVIEAMPGNGTAAAIPPLTEAQQSVADGFVRAFEESLQSGTVPRTSLLYGITGSGKTRVDIRLIEYMKSIGRQSIVLIPEISLTYQTVRELARVFGGRVSVLHSRLSEGERYEQYEKVRNGQIDVMVGPRSALFAPFERLGLIVIDEEHEGAYHSDTSPRYDAREAARKRASFCGAAVLLGSATPSLLSASRALSGEYSLYTLKSRAVDGAKLAQIHVCDLREELAAGNRSLFSRMLQDMIKERLLRGEQIILFINRRGYAGFASCRSCGKPLKCPHCDVSLTVHNSWFTDRKDGNKKGVLLSCHYCGYKTSMPARCPVCGSPYIAPFGTGTQKVETEVRRLFPEARVLRMDADSTAEKGAHERILNQFQNGQADILLGTQMIVKGHDFPRVTLVGILAADLSLYAPDYDAAERTFDLLVQASGRAGRGDLAGDVVVQTYDPSHYAVAAACVQNYGAFYKREMSYRRLLAYPPCVRMLFVRFQANSEKKVNDAAQEAASFLQDLLAKTGGTLIGPCNPAVPKVNDRYRKILYIKQESHAIIIQIREALREHMRESCFAREVQLSFELRI